MALDVIILAAGQGKRMCSQQPKVLHEVAGRSMLQRVIDTAKQLNPSTIHVVYGHQGDSVRQAMSHENLRWAHQAHQRGTGDAVKQAAQHIAAEQDVLVLYADVPLLNVSTLHSLLEVGDRTDLALLTAHFDNPTGFGRIIFNDAGTPIAIVEEKDASPHQRQLKEINTGVLLTQATHLHRWLPQLATDNAQQELYLTDVVAMAVAESLTVDRYCVNDSQEVIGVNDRLQLADVERICQRRSVDQLMRDGVTFYDPARVDIRGALCCQIDVVIDVNVIFEGAVSLGEGVRIGSHCVIRNSVIESDTVIHPHSVIDGATVGPRAQIGPFARLRPGTVLAEQSKVGNFVEVKQSRLGCEAKVSHLSYVGDAIIGDRVNIGAGTITCNYDGVRKHRTVIDDDAFIGSGTQLVAPVHVGKAATVGAGTSLRKDAPAGRLTVSHTTQKTFEHWRRPQSDD